MGRQLVPLQAIGLLGLKQVIEGQGTNNVINGSTIVKIVPAHVRIDVIHGPIRLKIGPIGVKNEGIMFVIHSTTTIHGQIFITIIRMRPVGV